MNKVLFIVRSYSRIGAQPIRFREIIRFLKLDFEVHVLELTHRSGGLRSEDGVYIHALPYSKIGRVFNLPEKSRNGSNVQNNISLLSRLLYKLKRNIRRSFFPDTVVTESIRIRREANRLVGDLKCDVVVVSAFPFSTLICLKSIKRRFSSKVILDIGDPFYKNSRNGFLKDILAKRYETYFLKYTDILVVTNRITRDHYLRSFGSTLNSKQVIVIEQGVSEIMLDVVRKSQERVSCSDSHEYPKLIYAGQLYRKLREPYELYKAIDFLHRKKKLTFIKLHMYGSYSREFYPLKDFSNCIVTRGQITYEDLIEEYLCADIVVFIDNAFGLQTPGKVFEIASLGKPVLFISDNPTSPAMEVVKGLSYFYFTRNVSEDISETIQKMLKEKAFIQIQGFGENFLWSERAGKYLKLLIDLIHEKNRQPSV